MNKKKFSISQSALIDSVMIACESCFFETKREHNFQKNENIALLHLKREEKNFVYLNSYRFFSLVYCLYCLNTSKQK